MSEKKQNLFCGSAKINRHDQKLVPLVQIKPKTILKVCENKHKLFYSDCSGFQHTVAKTNRIMGLIGRCKKSATVPFLLQSIQKNIFHKQNKKLHILRSINVQNLLTWTEYDIHKRCNEFSIICCFSLFASVRIWNLCLFRKC